MSDDGRVVALQFGDGDTMLGVTRSRRIVDLEGVLNCRDLGGLRTTDGREVCRGVMLRGGALVRAPLATWRALGIGTYVDLRTERERSRDPWLDCTPTELVCHCPVDTHEGPFLRANQGGRPSELMNAYVRVLPAAATAARRVLEAVAESDGQPVMVACTWGKDRTGVVAALVLDTLGVRWGDIACDYALTARELRPQVERLHSEADKKGVSRDMLARRVETVQATIFSLLEYVGSHYGSVALLMDAHGTTESLRSAVRKRALHPRQASAS